jgi:HK97 family phage prohead protease
MSKDKMDVERRIESLEDLELRVEPDADGIKKLTGYVARFNKPSEDLGGFTEKIAPGAFRDTIKGDDIRALKNHNPDWVLGRTINNTLRLKENARGLKMEVDLPDTTYARDLAVSIERGDITGQSFGFHTLEDSWEVKKRDGEEVNIRTLEKVALLDCGPVTFPAYPQTDVAVRALEAIKAERDKEEREKQTDKNEPPDGPSAESEQEGEQMPKHRVSILKKKLQLKEKEINP